jgi:hypothetical protein
MIKREVFTDWMGNTIADGDTIVLVRTKPLFEKITYGYSFKGKFTKLGQIKNTSKHIWKVQGEFKVWEVNNHLYYTLEDGDYKVHILVSSLLWMNDAVVCIKGLSDNRQEYYNKIE